MAHLQNNFRAFCLSTTLHGWQYVVETGTSKLRHYFWAVIVCLSMVTAGTFLYINTWVSNSTEFVCSSHDREDAVRAALITMYVKQCDCLKPCLWTTTFVDDRTSLIHYTFFKTKCNFRYLKNILLIYIFILKYKVYTQFICS
jgi:hypothetical protein